jgi:hypothetical protein
MGCPKALTTVGIIATLCGGREANPTGRSAVAIVEIKYNRMYSRFPESCGLSGIGPH